MALPRGFHFYKERLILIAFVHLAIGRRGDAVFLFKGLGEVGNGFYPTLFRDLDDFHIGVEQKARRIVQFLLQVQAVGGA